MNRIRLFLTAILCLVILASTACTGLIPTSGQKSPDEMATQNAYIVQAALGTATVMALQTQVAQLQTQVALRSTSQPVVITATALPPTDTPVPPTATLVPPSATPTNVPTPTHTPVPPTATAIPVPCNAAQFVSDVTIPDHSTLTAGSSFTKTWRLKNIGTCTWTTAYDVVFVSGDAMGAPAAKELPGSVAPGQVIDISVGMTAPTKEGEYKGNWKLRDANGVLFGLGRTDATFFVDIKVAAPTSLYPLDFVASMCLASWTSGAGNLPCPGTDGDSRGFVLRVDNPQLEGGSIDNEPVLLMFPQMIQDGVIRGTYPSFKVETGHHFMAIIGCAYQATACDVHFQLDYQISGGSIQTLKVWHEVDDGKINPLDVDLSSLAGKNVNFILTILANGAPTQDRAQWLAPRIIKK
ncbi:MAG TPA: NBR1-Ig-like domain-containing protein [Anaerolineaceae bacterium]